MYQHGKKYNMDHCGHAEEVTTEVAAARLEPADIRARDRRINKHGYERQMKSVWKIEDLIGEVK